MTASGESQRCRSVHVQPLAWTHSVTTTFAPSLAKSRATLRPIPWEEVA